MNIKPADFTHTMNALLKEYGDEVIQITVSAADGTAKEARNKLRANSAGAFKNRTGRYRRGWRANLIKKNTSVLAQVYNATDYQLTHLLENGHDVVRGGVVVGHAKAYPHIAEVNDWAITAFESELYRRLKEK